ncbi:MAG: glyoxalase [Aeromicrobium sp.]|uniref:VOC family protein n=1 Tax=Aeromicrobium sp. TaxID=1871063 RepID=UPI0039E5CB9E
MNTKIFLNLPSHDLEASKAFYTAVGATVNPNFTDDNAACLVFTEDIYLMVLRTDFMASFTDKPIVDPAEAAQAITCFMLDSREEVDTFVTAALACGGREPREALDYGFMYQRSIEDPSGNIIEVGYMDPKAAEVGPEAYLAEQGA